MELELILANIRKNRFIRLLAYPAYKLYTVVLLHTYQKLPSTDYLKSMRNIYAGKRCFVIGNGPSLLPEDLNKLCDEISFASNRIYNIYEYTDWRPTYYMCIDKNALPFMLDSIKKSGSYKKFLTYHGVRCGGLSDESICYLFPYGRYKVNPYAPKAERLNDDLSKYVTNVATVTVNIIELAIYMGFSEIYLLGVDNNYAKKLDKNGKVYNDPSVQSSYFAGMKDSHGKLGDGVSAQNVEAMNYSYQLAKQFADEHGVKIYNATRGGKLEVFPRVDFDSLFPPQNT